MHHIWCCGIKLLRGIDICCESYDTAVLLSVFWPPAPDYAVNKTTG